MGEDAFDPDDDDENGGGAAAVDWRVYMRDHSLTDKQQKLAQKVQKRQNRITALQSELDKIQVSQSRLYNKKRRRAPCI